MSTFLNQSDYQPLISDTVLNQVIQNQPAMLDEAELMAMAEMESYLSARFDTASLFAETGINRNKAIVMYLLDMTLYHLHSRVSPRNISQLREDRYKAAKEFLEMCAIGELSPNLPLKTDADGNVEDRFRFGSRTKFRDYWGND